MHPARHFILYLLTGNETRRDEKWIAASLRELDLFPDLCRPEVLRHLKDLAKPPAEYDPLDTTSKETIQFWRTLRVFDMHTQTSSARKAHEILTDPAGRDLAEPLLLSRTPFVEVARILNRKRNKRFKAEDIATFYHYFFEVDAISRSQWYETLKERKASPLLRSSLDGNSEVTRWRIGEESGIVFDFRAGLENAFKQCYMRIQELSSRPTTIENAKTLNLLVDALMRTNQGLVEAETGKSDMLRQLAEFRQSRKQPVIPSVHELGAYSGFNKGVDEGVEIVMTKTREAKSKKEKEFPGGDV